MSTKNVMQMAAEIAATAPVMNNERTATIVSNLSVSDFVKANGFTRVHEIVRASKANGQQTGLFVTFLDTRKPQNEQATNVWFSLRASQELAEGLAIEKGFFNDYQIVEMEYNDGEKRTKLALKGESRYNDINDIL